MRFILILFSLTIVCMLTSSNVFAIEPIMITISGDRENVIFDGKWTFYREWKGSSLNTINFVDGNTMELRTAHQGNFIYVMIDAVNLVKVNEHKDRAIICFDSNNTKSFLPDIGDYCFVATVGENQPVVLQGGSDLVFTNHYKKILNPPETMGVGGVSDVNDRYTTTPHESYEFKIPTNLIGRSDKYGFYMEVQNSNNFYSWPTQNSTSPDISKISSPNNWGQIVSPDKSLPEFPLPVITLVIGFSLFIYMTRTKLNQFRS
jgi:hypothetical protein